MDDNYQGRFVELCKKNNIISYTEPYNRSPFEQMQAGAKMDINMGEFWLKTPHFLSFLKTGFFHSKYEWQIRLLERSLLPGDPNIPNGRNIHFR